MSDKTEQPSAQILVVDDEVEHAEVMAEALRRLGHVCTIVHDRPAAEQELAYGSFDLVVTDLVMDRDDDGFKVLEMARQSQANAETIVVTAHGDVPTTITALKGGAFHFVEKPLDLDVFRSLCKQALKTVQSREQLDELRGLIDERHGYEGIIGTSPAIRRAIALMRQYAPSEIAVLITGASGTGKDLIAKAIHNNSKRSKGRFVPLNCAGLTESILEDELFGHVKGAFTNADRDREGRFEYADKGTLFLDEVGDMPLVMQAKLLRVLESGEIVRLGANEARHVDVRLVSATNQHLSELVKTTRFREDLYFRIRGVELPLPPLRERREDVPLLARHFIQLHGEYLDQVPIMAEDTMRALMRYDWPGNVRQLINVVQHMLVTCNGDDLEPRHLPAEVREASDGEAPDVPLDATAGMSLGQIEKRAIRNALRMSGGNREQAAKTLGIGERTLYRKLKEYGLK